MQTLSQFLWAVCTVFLLFISIYFTLRFHFIQFHFGKMFSSLTSKSSGTGVSPFQSLMMVLAGRIGVGSIAGVSLAIWVGGPGTLFWMWMTAFLNASACYAETVLGMKYQKKRGSVYYGGPFYYMKDGLKKPFLGTLYAILICISYLGGFLGIQSNTIVKSVHEMIPLSSCLLGIFIVFFTAIIIFGGVQRIAKTTEKLVPLMTLFYLCLSFVALFHCWNQIPSILSSIFTSAFQLKPFVSGYLPTMLIGIQRGLFSNESGLGTGSIASSSCSVDPKKQGYIQMLGVYITTLLICTSSAFLLLSTNYQILSFSDINGIELIQYAFSYHFGNFGIIFLVICIFFFSFSTILTGYYYVESAFYYLFPSMNQRFSIILKFVTLFILFLGSITSSTFLWRTIDFFVACLAIINLYALFQLERDC